jgi:VCBS repeat-containing protein
MSTKHFWSRFTHTAELPVRLIIIGSMLISALMLPLGTVSAVSSNRVMCEADSSLVGCWRMEEGSGTTLQDGGTTPFNDGTTVASPSFAPGKIGSYAIALNGSSQYARVLDENSLDITTAITLSAWVKPGKLGTQNILKKTLGTTTANGYELSLASNGVVFIRLNGALASRVDSVTLYPTDGNTWMHIAGTYDGTTLRIYINGVQNNTKAASITIGTNATNLGIGAEPAAAPLNFFQGSIDDARIYNRALSATEITALASTTPPGDITPPAAPTGLNAVPGDTIVNLTWTASADPDVKGYNVYRGIASHDYDPAPINGGTLVTTEFFDDSGLTNGLQYFYTVKAMDTSNNESLAATEASATPAGSNQAPVVTDIPDQTIAEGGSFTTIILDDYVSDVDNTDAEMTWSFSGDSALTVDIVDQVATITTPNADWNGSELITFRATDPGTLWDEDAATFTVTAVNDAPVCVDVTLTTTENTPGDTAPSCTDVDTGDTLTYSIVDQGSYGTASVVAGNLHYAPILDFNGPDSFTYKANDSHVDSNTANVDVTVTVVNDPPEVTDPGTQSSAEGDVISLQIVATDIDGPTLAYSALNLPDGLSIDPASGLISGTVTYHAAANSPYSASVTVTDGTTPVTVDFTWTISQASSGLCGNDPTLVGCWPVEEGSGTELIDATANGNDATISGTPSWVTGKIGSYAASFNGSTYAAVPDNPTLAITDAITLSAWVKPTINGTQYLIKKGNRSATPSSGFELGLATASGSTGAFFFRINDNTTCRVDSTVTYNNFFGTWVHVAATYDQTYLHIYVNGVLVDDAPTPCTASIVVDNTKSLALGAQSDGGSKFTGDIDDARLYNRVLSSDEIQALAGLNVAPVVTDIPDQTIAEGASFTTISLDDYVSDVDNTDAEMTWSYSGNTYLSVSIINRVATITPLNADWNGSETITFKATDPGTLWDEDAATFTVTAVNSAPVVTDIPDQTVAEGDSFTTISLDDYVSDVDNTDAEMTWSYSGNAYLSVSIVDRVATITPLNADWNGSEMITFKATDPGDLWDEDAATFTVTGVNDAPVVMDIPDQTVAEGTSFAIFSLDDYVSDVDNTGAEISWSYSGNAHLSVSIVDLVVTITPLDADWNGSETITFRATDPGDLWDEDAATFTVTAVNDAPVLDPIGPKGTAELVPLLFTATATDVDVPADTLTYNLADGAGGSVPEGAGIGSTSGDFSWTPTEAQGPGTYTFDVCVSDGSLSDCETISVTVSEVATSPVAVPDAYEVLESGIFMVAAPGVLANDSDADIPADTLTAILDSSTTHGSLILNADGSFTYTPAAMWSGIDTFTYKVYDGTSYSEVVSVTITVKIVYFYFPMINR